MRNGILLNNNDKIDFTLFSIQSNLASISVNPDSTATSIEYYYRKHTLTSNLLSQLFLYDEVYIVQPDTWVDYSKIGNYMDLHIIDEQPMKQLDSNYASYIKEIVLKTLIQELHVGSNKSLFLLIQEMYDSMVSTGGIDLGMREKFLDFISAENICVAKQNFNVDWTNEQLLWNMFSSKVFENIWHYTNEVILNLEYSSLNNLVICGSNMDYTHSLYNENEVACYKILKTTINDYHAKTPAFTCIEDVIRFKEKNHFGIMALRNEISNLEQELRRCGYQQAV